jgi:DNA-binding transcriptional MerR regulator
MMPTVDEDQGTPDAMTIHQLSMLSGVPARRIRYYIKEGLIAPPLGQGRAAHYESSHLTRLREVRRLRDLNIGLDEIRRRLGDPTEPRQPTQPESYTWQRWEIRPGIELHVRADLAPDVADLARFVVNAARQTFDGRLSRRSSQE